MPGSIFHMVRNPDERSFVMFAHHQPGKRALRRRALARQKRRAKAIYPHDAKAGLANHLASCSCPMCGNSRKWFNEPTMVERRAADAGRADTLDLP